MIKQITLLAKEHVDFKENIEELIAHFGDVFAKQQRGFIQHSHGVQLGFLLNYKGNAVYEFITKRKLTLRNIDALKRNIEIIKKAKSITEEQQKILDRLSSKIEEFNARIHNIDDPADNGTELDNLKSGHSKALECFLQTTWYLYERFEKSIGRKVVLFGAIKRSGRIEVNIIPVNSSYSEISGTAYSDAFDQYMMIEAYNRKRKSSYTTIMLRLNDHCESLKIATGHMTFPHRDNHNIVTKTVVFEKYGGDEEATSKDFRFHNPVESQQVPLSVLKYLYERPQNRLSSPHSIIFDETSFRSWHEKNDTVLQLERPKPELHCSYELYFNLYPWEELRPQPDKLEIYTTPSGKVMANYSHQPMNESEEEWDGAVHMNETVKIMSILLHGPYTQVLNTDRKQIVHDKQLFLMLTIPPGDLKTVNVFTGLISGLRDRDKGPVSRLVVALRKDAITSVQKDVILAEFFSAYAERSWVRPPVETIPLQIKDLDTKKIKNEGWSTRKALRKRFPEEKQL